MTAILLFGLVGYVMLPHGYSMAGASLAALLGGEPEASLRQGLVLTDNSWARFFSRPVTAAIMLLVFLSLAYGLLVKARVRRASRSVAAG